MQIASSKIIYPIASVVKINVEDIDINSADMQYKEIRLRTICPAVIFAANRKDKVIGRTIILVDSIITRNGLSHSGAPSGRKWAVDFLGEYENEEISILIHKGNPIVSVIIRCLEDDNEYGIIPIKLIVISKINSDVIVIDIPFKLILEVRDNWFIIKLIIGVDDENDRLEIFHIFSWIVRNRKILIIIAKVDDGVNSLYVIGSKIEKMSPIIKIWYEPFKALKAFSLC